MKHTSLIAYRDVNKLVQRPDNNNNHMIVRYGQYLLEQRYFVYQSLSKSKTEGSSWTLRVTNV